MKLLQRDVVWVSFPFTDGRAFKERPALVLSPAEYNQTSLDVLLCYITSRGQGDYLIPITQKELDSTVVTHAPAFTHGHPSPVIHY